MPGVLACAACALVVLSGCSGKRVQPQEQRKLLIPPDLKAARAAALEARRLFDADGKLLASDIEVADLTLPRGLTEYRSFDHEWYFKSSDIGIDPIVDYFSERLTVATVERSAGGGVRLLGAKPKDKPDVPQVSLFIAPLGPPKQTRVHIRQAKPIPEYTPNAFEAELQIKAMAEHAD